MPNDFAPHSMTANNAPAPYVARASSQYSSYFYAYKAFDGGAATNQYWLATTSTGWLEIDTGGSYLLDNYSVRVNVIPEPNRAPKSWTLEGSNDQVNWDVLDTVTDQTGWTSGEVRNFTCDVIASGYRFFRINITLNNGDAYLQVAELFLFGDSLIASTQYLKHRGRDRMDFSGVSLGL